jgi:hypothetical protein
MDLARWLPSPPQTFSLLTRRNKVPPPPASHSESLQNGNFPDSYVETFGNFRSLKFESAAQETEPSTEGRQRRPQIATYSEK